jgi:hypothetical protein
MRRGLKGLRHSVAFNGPVAGLAVATALLVGGAARADQVTSKGTVLRGKITGVSSAGVTIEPEYGKGALAIKWENIEDLKSDGNFQILYGEDQESDVPLQGFTAGKLFVGSGIEGATQIDVATIHSGFPIGPDGPSWRDELRSGWRYWDGNFDVGFNLQQATTDTTGLLLGFKTTRKKDPLRLLFGATYRYATQKQQGEQSTTIQDQWYGIARGEYDIIERLYGFASGEATYDAIQHLSIRGIPKAGLGYTFFEEKLDEDNRNFLAGEVGGAWVYERYFGGDTNDYFAIALSAIAGYHLPYGAHWDGRVDYLPAVDNFTVDYLLRGETSLTMPVIDPVSAKLSVIDEYDNTPAANTNRNSLFIAFGLSVGW